MVAETTTAPPAEEVFPVESEPKPIDQVTTDPSIVTEANEDDLAAAESRDVVEVSESGDVTPSSARNEFIFSPQPPKSVSKSKSEESKGSAKAEEAPIEEVADVKEEPVAEEPEAEPAAEEPVAEEPATEEVAEETPAEEETAPVEEAAPAEAPTNMFTSLLEKATALCGSAESATLLAENELEQTSSIEAKDSDVAKSKSGEETKAETSVFAKAKAAVSCAKDSSDDALQTEAVEQDDDLVAEDKEETEEPVEEEQKAVEEVSDKVEVEEPKVEEPHKEEEPAPAVEAPKKKKMSMVEKIKQMLGCTSKPAVVE
jgi:hypothetical protein